ncbi:SpoIIE family protein phosphatase [Gorillibacterium sp. sgz5001074]|uniref:SpoIIE family protein phosphatase n=1 Tax=Gorillibacterium sp. sgz5001074 TaxID=3446695 RepID=UPI003F6677AF
MGGTEKGAGPDRKPDKPLYGYDRSVYKVMILASILMVLSMIMTGFFGYWFTRDGVVDKLKRQELGTIAQSIAGQVDGRLERAQETAVILSDDTLLRQWVAGGEKDPELTAYAVERLHYLKAGFDYSSSFIVSGTTRQYWSESGAIIETVSESDPDDVWFFNAMKSKTKVFVDVDYNEVRKDTFAFINALMGNPDKPEGVAGVGMNLQELSKEFQTYKYGPGSNVWLVDRSGQVLLSDQTEHNGRNLTDFVPEEVKRKVEASYGGPSAIMEIRNQRGNLTDLISFPLKSTDLRLLVLIERNETVSFLETIKNNTILAVIITVISVIVMFYFTSRRLANPYKRALELNRELEQVVSERTRELALRNEEIMDGISYAHRIQETIQPSEEQLHGFVGEAAVIWKPKDVVGGDFYWVRPYRDGCLVAVGDCTGHGVPGAFMTMLSVSMLDRIIERQRQLSPGEIIGLLNTMLKTTLRQEERGGRTDDGLDLGLCYIGADGRVVFAGAGCSLYVRTESGVTVLDGEKRSVGYTRTPMDFEFRSQEVPQPSGSDAELHLVTDGLFDQNGGAKGNSYGKSRFIEWLEQNGGGPLAEVKERLRQELEEFRGYTPQRDDMTWLAFRPSRRDQEL